MINRVARKIRTVKRIIKEGIFPERVFDLFYQNGGISASEFNQRVISSNEANQWLKDQIESGKPFFASRFGNAELGLVNNLLFNRILNREMWSDYSKQIVARDPSWGGDIKYQESFYEDFLKGIASIDGLGIWYNHGEQLMANYICPNATLFELRAYEPFFYDDPWTMSLQGKKVLVVHPYTHSIPYQYAKRDLLFKQKVLPAFELSCYEPFTTYGDDWKNYRDAGAALDKMKKDISLLDFDIALVASGPFGLPLSAEIKKMKKQVIHIGGGLQLFFGILGKRWETPDSDHLKFFNEHWKRPFPEEIPTDPRVLKFSDGGCYW